MGTIHNIIVGPETISLLWPYADKGTVIERQNSSLGLFLGDLRSISHGEPAMLLKPVDFALDGTF